MGLDPSAARCTKGLIESARGDYEQAAYQFREAITLRPKFAEAHCGLGSLLILQGQVKEGIAELREALECNRHSARDTFTWREQLLRQGEWASTLWHLEKARAVQPGSADGLVRPRQGSYAAGKAARGGGLLSAGGQTGSEFGLVSESPRRCSADVGRLEFKSCGAAMERVALAGVRAGYPVVRRDPTA